MSGYEVGETDENHDNLVNCECQHPITPEDEIYVCNDCHNERMRKRRLSFNVNTVGSTPIGRRITRTGSLNESVKTGTGATFPR